MLELVQQFERFITLIVIAMLAIVVALATIELGVSLARDILTPPIFFPGIDRLLDIFGRVLLVVIGIELLETLRSFARGGVVRAEVVLTVALIAVARKVIVLEPAHASAVTLFGVASLVLSVAIAYRMFVRGRPLGKHEPREEPPRDQP
jgi:uncharacterized membrane protein (DUF373 family)